MAQRGPSWTERESIAANVLYEAGKLYQEMPDMMAFFGFPRRSETAYQQHLAIWRDKRGKGKRAIRGDGHKARVGGYKELAKDGRPHLRDRDPLLTRLRQHFPHGDPVGDFR
jgi:hypothetical protein